MLLILLCYMIGLSANSQGGGSPPCVCNIVMYMTGLSDNSQDALSRARGAK